MPVAPFIIALAAGMSIGCGASAPPPAGVAAPPAEWQEAIARADAAIESLKSALMQRLLEQMNAGGPVAAIGVCRDVAQEAAREAGREHGLEIGRTSHRLRNLANAPRAWVRPYLEQVADLPAHEVAARFYDLGDRIGVVRPIPTGGLCVTCHGSALDAKVGEALAQGYPDDRATGFAEGDLRGLFWVEVPRAKS